VTALFRGELGLLRIGRACQRLQEERHLGLGAGIRRLTHEGIDLKCGRRLWVLEHQQFHAAGPQLQGSLRTPV
jgi:hypothetical protein